MKNIKTIGILALLLAGTGTAFSQSRKTESTKGVEQTDGKTIQVDGIGHKLNYTLNGGTVEVSGGDNIVTVTRCIRKCNGRFLQNFRNRKTKFYIDKVEYHRRWRQYLYITELQEQNLENECFTGVGNKVAKQ
jgi:hypothetical protein